MFYAILALLIFEPYSSSKHSGVLSYFNKHFIKKGILPEELGRAVNKAYELRQRGDSGFLKMSQYSRLDSNLHSFNRWSENASVQHQSKL